MVDNKLNTGSIRKKHLAQAKSEKTKKIVEKVKSESAYGPPAKKPKRPKKAKEESDVLKPENGSPAKAKAGAKKHKNKKKAIKDTPVKNIERTNQREEELQESAGVYLDQWKNDKGNWRFSKNIQTWLIVNMFKTERVSSDHFGILCDYLLGGKGTMRENTLKTAMKKSRDIRNITEPNPEDAEENQEVLARCNRVIKMMTSAPKTADSKKGAAASPAPTKAAPKKKKDKGKRDQLGLRKENKAPPKVKAEAVKAEESSETEKPSPKKGKKAGGVQNGKVKKNKKVK